MIRVKDGVSLHNVSADEVHVKIGRAMQMQHRLDSYGTGFADSVDVLYQVQTDDMVNVEACIKTLCREKKYRKRKEVYTIDVDIMKHVVDHCAQGAAEVRRVPGKRNKPGATLPSSLLANPPDHSHSGSCMVDLMFRMFP